MVEYEDLTRCYVCDILLFEEDMDIVQIIYRNKVYHFCGDACAQVWEDE